MICLSKNTWMTVYRPPWIWKCVSARYSRYSISYPRDIQRQRSNVILRYISRVLQTDIPVLVQSWGQVVDAGLVNVHLISNYCWVSVTKWHAIRFYSTRRFACGHHFWQSRELHVAVADNLKRWTYSHDSKHELNVILFDTYFVSLYFWHFGAPEIKV